ncbi:MAG: enoyl-ACP reductase [Planctomycetota bacterium]
MGSLLEGKKGIVLGVANKRSIAWAIAKTLSDHGAQLAFSYQGEKLLSRVQPLVEELPGTSPLYSLDVTNDEEIAGVADKIKSDFGSLDFVIHSVAFADRKDLEGNFVDTSRSGYLMAQEVSSYSLVAVSKAFAPLMTDGGSIVTMTYLGGERVVQNYNVMGVAKAALESSVRYLAAGLGEQGIRVNAVSAGPVNTLAARGIAGFTDMLAHVAERAPLKRNVELQEVANTALFFASPLSTGVTGEVTYVDCGFNILGM